MARRDYGRMTVANGKAEEIVTEDVGGVQGSDPAAADNGRQGGDPEDQVTPQQTPDMAAPDAGEIEWAGGLIKKPPAPAQ